MNAKTQSGNTNLKDKGTMIRLRRFHSARDVRFLIICSAFAIAFLSTSLVVGCVSHAPSIGIQPPPPPTIPPPPTLQPPPPPPPPPTGDPIPTSSAGDPDSSKPPRPVASYSSKHRVTKTESPQVMTPPEFQDAHIAFNPPDTVYMDSVIAIGLDLSLKEIAESSLDELREYSQGKSTITQKVIKISKKVKATLSGDFEICSMPQLEQDIIDSSVYSWVWNIKPKSAGTKYLNLDIVTIIELEGKTTTKSIKVFHEPMAVVVKEKPKSWSDYAALIFGKLDLKWIYGTFLLPLILYVWKRIQEKRKKKPSKKSDQKA